MAVGRFAYGTYPQFVLQLEIEFEDGRKQTIATDDTWRTTIDGPLRSSGIYDGETYDARKDIPGWDKASYPDDSWHSAKASDIGPARLVWQRNEPIQVVKELKAVKMTIPQPGTLRLRFRSKHGRLGSRAGRRCCRKDCDATSRRNAQRRWHSLYSQSAWCTSDRPLYSVCRRLCSFMSPVSPTMDFGISN